MASREYLVGPDSKECGRNMLQHLIMLLVHPPDARLLYNSTASDA